MVTELDVLRKKKELLKITAEREEALAREKEELRALEERIRIAKFKKREDIRRMGRVAKGMITTTGKMGVLALKDIDKVVTGGKFFSPPPKRRIKVIKRKRRRS